MNILLVKISKNAAHHYLRFLDNLWIVYIHIVLGFISGVKVTPTLPN